MKKNIKFLGLFLSLAMLISLFTGLGANAASGTIIKFSSNVKSGEVLVGEQFTVTVTVRSDQPMYGASAEMPFSKNEFIEFVSCDDNTNLADGTILMASSAKAKPELSYSVTFKAVKEGKFVFSVKAVKAVHLGNEEIELTGAGAPINVVAERTPDNPSSKPTESSEPSESSKPAESSEPTESSKPEPPKSDDNNLKSMVLSEGTLTPKFSPKVTNYKATVENGVSVIDVSAVPAAGAKVTGTGKSKLKVGDNKLYFTVTSESGKKKTYVVVVKRLPEEKPPVSSEESTSSESVSSQDTPSADVLITFIKGEQYHIIDKLPEGTKAPKGFETDKTGFNGTEVEVFVSPKKEYVLYTLKRDEDGKTGLYTYSSTRDEFAPLKFMNHAGKMYILPSLPPEYEPPEGYIRTTASLGNTTVPVFCSENPKMADFCYFYAFENGKYGYYCYDMFEKTIQRAPYFATDFVIEEQPQSVQASGGILSSFKDMPIQGKVTVIAFAVALICIITIVILLIIRFTKSKDFDDDDMYLDFDGDFDEINHKNSAENSETGNRIENSDTSEDDGSTDD